MKKSTGLWVLFFYFSALAGAQNVGINGNASTPDPSAILDLSTGNAGGNLGFLAPQVNLSDVTKWNPPMNLGSSVEGIIVYNTNNGITGGNGKGYYYWGSNNQWNYFMNPGNYMDWGLTGNSGTSSATNFLGTTDGQDLVFKAKNTEWARILNSTGGIKVTGEGTGYAILGPGTFGAGYDYTVLNLNGKPIDTKNYNFTSSIAGNDLNLYINRPTGYDINFRENNNNTAGSPTQMCLKSGGNVGIGNTAPNSSAILDLTNPYKRGFLPNNVALTKTNSSGPVASPATGLLVYNTATANSPPNNVMPGHYYWDGSEWDLLKTYPSYSSVTGYSVNSNSVFDNSTTGAYTWTWWWFQDVTSLTLSTKGTYLIKVTAEVTNDSYDGGTNITLTDGSNYWGNSEPSLNTADYWTPWTTSATVTINSSTTYTVQIAAAGYWWFGFFWIGSNASCRNVQITAIKIQ